MCCCSAGLLRSPTAAWILSNPPFDFNTRAAGITKDYALIHTSPALLLWADAIVVMDEDQEIYLRSMMKGLAEHIGIAPDKIIHVLDVPDTYGTRDPALIKLTFELSDLA